MFQNSDVIPPDSVLRKAAADLKGAFDVELDVVCDIAVKLLSVCIDHRDATQNLWEVWKAELERN